MNILEKYAPRALSDVIGQPTVIASLSAFVRNPTSCAFVFSGSTGVGKSCTAIALAHELGCAVDEAELGGLLEIPSGKQDGKAVEEMLRQLRLRPLFGSGWKVAIINEADFMTSTAEGIWLDGLEHLPPKTVIVFTTNHIHSLSRRLIGRCETYAFDSDSEQFQAALHSFVAKIVRRETGRPLRRIPDQLGRYELADPSFSIRLALQQIVPMLRDGIVVPKQIAVPFIRSTESIRAESATNAARKAWATRRAN